MRSVSSLQKQNTWQNKRQVVNLLAVLATEENRVAERLLRIREAYALTQEQAAARAGVTLRAWQRWERGQSAPYARNLAKISDEFKIPLHELVGEQPAPELTQMDRMEAKLDELLRRLPEAAPQVDPFPEELEDAMQALLQTLRARLAAPKDRAPISPGEYRRGRRRSAAA